jgi:hypothetical protein
MDELVTETETVTPFCDPPLSVIWLGSAMLHLEKEV